MLSPKEDGPTAEGLVCGFRGLNKPNWSTVQIAVMLHNLLNTPFDSSCCVCLNGLCNSAVITISNASVAKQ